MPRTGPRKGKDSRLALVTSSRQPQALPPGPEPSAADSATDAWVDRGSGGDGGCGVPDDAAAPLDGVAHDGRRGGVRAVAMGVLTGLAALLVFAALVAPKEFAQLTPAAFVRIPVEALLGVALLLVLPPRARQVAAALGGLVLGLLTVLKILDMGFVEVLARPFDPVLDWVLFDDALSFLTDAVGSAGAIGSLITVVVLVIAVPVLLTLAVLRLTPVLVRHRATTARAVAALAAVWLACAVLGAQIVAPVPVAARSVASIAYEKAMQVRASIEDQRVFAELAAVDAFRDTAGEDLLTALRGKDVVFSVVESYGRDAVEDPEFAPQIGELLDDGDRRLSAAGYASQSAFLTAPVAGGGSWLAHATLLSGLWIDNNQRHHNLVSSDRLTLTGAFQRAGWQTVGVMPGNDAAWPEGEFYGYDRVHDGRNLGYRGPKFGWAPMPDQYTLSAFERAEHATPDRGPLMAEIALTSSHMPWAHIPRMVDWNDVGDGSIFNPMVTDGEPVDALWQDPTRVRTEYRRSIEYSLNSLISYVETYGDDDLVLVFLGDHQPAPVITGDGASRDVPITIVTRDRAVLDRISEWGWQDGLKPGPQAPAWRMDAFRDRFLTAFGSTGSPPAGAPTGAR